MSRQDRLNEKGVFAFGELKDNETVIKSNFYVSPVIHLSQSIWKNSFTQQRRQHVYHHMIVW